MSLSKFLDPKNDVAFKKIFGTEKNKDILIHFLNDMLKFKCNRPIVKISFLKTIQDPETAAKKTSNVDILCQDDEGNFYIVEMQVAQEKGFIKRAQYYASKAYSSQIYVSGKYETLKEVIFLAIADFKMFPEKKDFKSDHVILDKKTYEHDLKDFSFTFVELPKFKKKIDALSNIVDKWCYFFKHAAHTSEADLKKLIGSDLVIERAYEELNRFNWDEIEMRTYEEAQKQIDDQIAIMDQKFDEGEKKGKEVGRIEGRVEERIEIAKALLLEGVDLKMIVKVTKLPEEEIKKLLL